MQLEPSAKIDEIPRAATGKFYAVTLLALMLAAIGLVGYQLHMSTIRTQGGLLIDLAEQRLMIERIAGLSRLMTYNSNTGRAVSDQNDAAFLELEDTVGALVESVRGIEATLAVVFRTGSRFDYLRRQPSAADIEKIARHTQRIATSSKTVKDLVDAGPERLRENAALRAMSRAFETMAASTGTIEQAVRTETIGQLKRQSDVLTIIMGSFIAILLVVMLGIFRPLMKDLRIQMEATVLSRRRMSYLANHDVLTGMPNRLKMREATQNLLADAQQHGRNAGSLLIDLDDFKPINDTYGHSAGDAVLKEAARRILETVGKHQGIGARIGGDEFAVAFGSVPDIPTLRQYADSVAAALAQPIDIGGRTVNVGCSIGAAFYPDHGDDSGKLYNAADRAMYVAKENGKRVCLFGDELYESVEHPERIRSVLIRALLNGEFEMHYQPTVRLADAKAFGAEALIRWRKPGHGLVPPGAFIPDAERTGAIVELTEFALNDALNTWKDWRARDLVIERIGVNIPEAVLAGPLTSIFQPLLDRSEGDLSWLTVEVTENVFIDQAHEAIRDRLNWLAANGARIALDDFGTGYASLAHLRSFPFHCLKIDRSFVSSLREDVNADAIVRSIIDLARNLKASVVAEGVETEAQRAFLLIDGCEVAQGFLFSKALPAEELFELLTTRSNLDPLSDDTEGQLMRFVGADLQAG